MARLAQGPGSPLLFVQESRDYGGTPLTVPQPRALSYRRIAMIWPATRHPSARARRALAHILTGADPRSGASNRSRRASSKATTWMQHCRRRDRSRANDHYILAARHRHRARHQCGGTGRLSPHRRRQDHRSNVTWRQGMSAVAGRRSATIRPGRRMPIRRSSPSASEPSLISSHAGARSLVPIHR